MNRPWSLLLAAGVATTSLLAQGVTDSPRLLARRYVEGNRLRYRMTGNENGTTFQVTILAMTTKPTDGRFVEEIAWSDMVVNGAPRALTSTSQTFRVAVTLEGSSPYEWPDLSKAPGIIGPVTDMLNFYRIQVSTTDGRILSATLENAVTKIRRDCSDIALTQCGEPRPDPTLRHIEISLLSD